MIVYKSHLYQIERCENTPLRFAMAFEDDCPTELRAMIVDDAQKIIDMRGQRFPTSASGQSVILGTTV